MSQINKNPHSILEIPPEKRTFATLFIILAIVLMVLPFFTTFNDILTRIVMKIEVYRFIQDAVVPIEIKMIGVITSLLGIKTQALAEYIVLEKGSGHFLVEIAWNCIGWQSLIILIISFITGLQGEYTQRSKLQVVLIGLLGTFLMNILRIAFVVLVAYFWGQFPAIIFHDYGSILITIGWLFFFWWFSYSYILESREEGLEREV